MPVQCPVKVVRHDGGVGTDAHKATGQDCDDGSADHLLLLHIPSAPGSENLRTRRVSTGERGRRGACVRGRNRSTPSPLLLCYPRQPVSLVVTCAPCDEVVLEAEVFDHEEECLLRDHLLLVQPRTISARDPRRAAGISSSPNRRRRQRSRVYSTVRRRSLSPRSSGMRSTSTSGGEGGCGPRNGSRRQFTPDLWRPLRRCRHRLTAR